MTLKFLVATPSSGSPSIALCTNARMSSSGSCTIGGPECSGRSEVEPEVGLGVEDECLTGGSEGVGVVRRAGASVGGKTDEADEEGSSPRAAADVLDSARAQGQDSE